MIETFPLEKAAEAYPHMMSGQMSRGIGFDIHSGRVDSI